MPEDINSPGATDIARGPATEASPMQEAGYTHTPIRVCTECGTEYQDRGKGSGIRRNLCSQACATAVRERLAAGGRGGRAQTCAMCGITFLGKPAARFCSRKCCHEKQKVTHLRGETIPCAHCGEDFYRKRSQPNQRFCSHECRGAAMPPPSSYPNARAKISEAKMGEGNPMFRDGLSPDTVRRRHFNIALKGEDRCRNCGATGQLHMHHVIPRSMHRQGITEILNGIPLCPRCHHGWHHRSITICREIFTVDEWAYLTSVKLVGQDVLAWLDDRYPGPRDDCAA